MKPLFFFLCLAVGLSANAQVTEIELCHVDSQYTLAGLYPNYDSLPCFERGKCNTASLQFVNLDSILFSGVKVKIEQTLIEDIINLPCGLQWYTNSWHFGVPYPIENQENVCFWLGGVAQDSVGLYKISIIATVTFNSNSSPTPIEVTLNLSDYGYPLFLRVKDSASVCQVIDTSAAFVTSNCSSSNISCAVDEFGTFCDTCDVSSHSLEISAYSALQPLYPNPAIGYIAISFTASRPHLLRWQIVDVLGRGVAEASFDAMVGLNKETIDVSALPNGMYIFMVDYGMHTTNQRFVIAR